MSVRWSLLVVLVFASSFLGAQQQMQVVSSVPLPEIWNRIDYARSSCGDDGDFIALLAVSSAGELPHELVHIGANGAMLGYFDLHRTPGFENGTMRAVRLDAAGKIVLLVRNVISTRLTKTDAEGRPTGATFQMDRNSWVLTVDDKGRVLNKFSFDERLVMPLQFALFRSGNVLIFGHIQQGQPGELIAAVIFSSAGVMLVNLKLPMAAGRGPADWGALAQLHALAGDADEVFIAHSGTEPYLLKVSADGTVGPKVMFAIPKDERASIQKIAGHRAMALIGQAKPLAPGTIIKTPEWTPEAVFDTESGALLDTLLVPQHELGPVCYSESGMTFIRTPEGTLDSLVPKPAAR